MITERAGSEKINETDGVSRESKKKQNAPFYFFISDCLDIHNNNLERTTKREDEMLWCDIRRADLPRPKLLHNII